MTRNTLPPLFATDPQPREAFDRNEIRPAKRLPFPKLEVGDELTGRGHRWTVAERWDWHSQAEPGLTISVYDLRSDTGERWRCAASELAQASAKPVLGDLAQSLDRLVTQLVNQSPEDREPALVQVF
ncbi:hypothetical protein E8L99_17635 [Phreatobacter aquaticus]|uniref:Uncharacterized protein n=1 Tax=Phreatobacter aquaticus TaxID=2570229 RepID=A0A4D7QPF7_9HYPH|nr:hypothetical protein [Phreatobacter aquaticus]QCK87449.1 hypothetical protein E8L99_17635 [Phreatobacter aquaticus]